MVTIPIIPDTSISHQCENSDLVTDLRIRFAEMSRDMINLAACFEELNAQLTEFNMGMREFTEKQEQRTAQISDTCTTRSVRWGEINLKISTFEKALPNIYARLETIENVHAQELGGKVAVKPYKDYIVYVFMLLTNLFLVALLLRGGITVT